MPFGPARVPWGRRSAAWRGEPSGTGSAAPFQRQSRRPRQPNPVVHTQRDSVWYPMWSLHHHRRTRIGQSGRIGTRVHPASERHPERPSPRDPCFLSLLRRGSTFSLHTQPFQLRRTSTAVVQVRRSDPVGSGTQNRTSASAQTTNVPGAGLRRPEGPGASPQWDLAPRPGGRPRFDVHGPAGPSLSGTESMPRVGDGTGTPSPGSLLDGASWRQRGTPG